ncbi:MAG: SRPBCC family protein [Actinomycetes bacterium]|jgi:hypothetical protein
MPRYVVTVPSSWSPDRAYSYMADMTNYVEWDRGILRVTQTKGSGGGEGAVYEVTTRGFGGRDMLLTYETTEHDGSTNVLLVGKNFMFTSVDRITVAPSATGCDVTYDAKLTFNGVLAPLNLPLGLVFNKVGDAAARGLRKKLA